MSGVLLPEKRLAREEAPACTSRAGAFLTFEDDVKGSREVGKMADVAVMSPRPGRVARICRVRLPRPRTVEARASADFGRPSLEIYDLLIARLP